MNLNNSVEQAVMDKIHYRCIDVPCCLTCAHGEDIDVEALMCRATRYYSPEMGGKAY